MKKKYFKKWHIYSILATIILVLLLIRFPIINNNMFLVDNSICESGKMISTEPDTILGYFNYFCNSQETKNSNNYKKRLGSDMINAFITESKENPEVFCTLAYNIKIGDLEIEKGLAIINTVVFFQLKNFRCDEELQIGLIEKDLENTNNLIPNKNVYKLTEKGTKSFKDSNIGDYIYCNNNIIIIINKDNFNAYKNKLYSCVLEEKPEPIIIQNITPNNKCYIPILDTSQNNIGTCTQVLTTNPCKYITQNECEKELSKSLFARIMTKIIEILDKIFNWK